MQILSKSSDGLWVVDKDELRIANEIYLTERLVKIHYGDVMDIIPEDTSTKDSLIAWLNDSVRKGVLVREGILTTYKKDRPNHFEGGKWKPECFPDYIEYGLKKLIDRDYMVDSNLRNKYIQSVQNVEWFEKACAVMGLKLLESLYLEEGLTSEIANIRMNMNYNTRDLLKKSGRMIGRVGKNNKMSQEFNLEFNETVEKYYKKQFELSKILHSKHEEYTFLEKHKEFIVGQLAGSRLNVIEGSSVQLVIDLE